MSKTPSLILLLIAEVAAMSLWFVSAAILPDMNREVAISDARQAALSSAVQLGFVAGALASAVLGLADRFDPRRVFAATAVIAALANGGLLVVAPGSDLAIGLRFLTGAMLAGVYPVGMKIVSGWGVEDRGFLVGLLVAALTLGSASPHLVVWLGGAEWRFTVGLTSLIAGFGGLLGLVVGLGPYHAKAAKFNPSVVLVAWTNRRVRLAYIGYLGHMWELYAMWAWVGTAAAASYAMTLGPAEAQKFGTLTAFIAIAAGGIACAGAGFVADRLGKAEVTILAMAVSGAAAIGTALTFGGPVWITFFVIVIWGIAIIPDSAQFSALVADAAEPHTAGTLLTLQTALGFALTFGTVQVTPILAEMVGWPVVLAGLALGPAYGIWGMMRLRKLQRG